MTAATRVGESRLWGAGRGLFAARDISRGDEIVGYGGMRRVFRGGGYAEVSARYARERQRQNAHSVIRLLDYEGEVGVVMDGEGGGGNFGYMANSYPGGENARFEVRGETIVLVAMRDISEGEELYVNYGMHEFGDPVVDEAFETDAEARRMLSEMLGRSEDIPRPQAGGGRTTLVARSKKGKKKRSVGPYGYIF